MEHDGEQSIESLRAQYSELLQQHTRLLHNSEAMTEQMEDLKVENELLRKKILVYEQHPTIRKGSTAEELIRTTLNASSTTHNASHDLVLERDGRTIEVKFSKLNTPVRSSRNKCKRWAWGFVFGHGGNKEYDNLILVGVADERYSKSYLEPSSPIVIFDVPFDDVYDMTINSSGKRIIQLTSNPLSSRGAAGSVLWDGYEITLKELSRRYESKPGDAGGNPSVQ